MHYLDIPASLSPFRGVCGTSPWCVLQETLQVSVTNLICGSELILSGHSVLSRESGCNTGALERLLEGNFQTSLFSFLFKRVHLPACISPNKPCLIPVVFASILILQSSVIILIIFSLLLVT